MFTWVFKFFYEPCVSVPNIGLIQLVIKSNLPMPAVLQSHSDMHRYKDGSVDSSQQLPSHVMTSVIVSFRQTLFVCRSPTKI